MGLRIHLLAGARPFEAAVRPIRFAFSGHGVANLTLPWLAAMIPPRHRVSIQDEQVQPLDLQAPMDLALISAKTCYAPRAYAIAARLRSRGVPVVLGGCHTTLNPREASKHVDAIVLGEADQVIHELLADVADGCLKPRYQGGPVALDRLPLPRRDLLQKRYIIDAVGVSRGCSHACSFCCIRSLYGPGCRTRPIGEVVDEIRRLGPFLGFLDENLVADFDYAQALFEALIPLKRRWLAQVSVDMLEQPGLVELAGRSGAVGFFFGMETVEQANLDAAGKLHNSVDRYGELVRECHDAGIAVGAGMLFGLEHDGPDCFERTRDVMQQLGVDQGYFKIATPYPGTAFFSKLEAEDRILSRDWAYYDGCFPVFQPEKMSPRQLFEGVCWIRQAYYSPRAVAQRMRRFWRLRLPWWAQINMNRLARDAYRKSELLGQRFLLEIGQ